MKKFTAVLVTVGAGVLLMAAPAAAEDDGNAGQVGVYGTKAPTTQDPVIVSQGVLPATPVPAVPVAIAAPVVAPVVAPVATPIVVSATPSASNPLPVTGSDSALTLQAGMAVLLTGAGLLAVSRMRRRTLRTATI